MISIREQVCGVTCCGLVNFEQHCSSKKHLRRAAAAAGALAGGGMASDSTGDERNTTYVGLQAQCRNYCKQARGLIVPFTQLWLACTRDALPPTAV